MRTLSLLFLAISTAMLAQQATPPPQSPTELRHRTPESIEEAKKADRRIVLDIVATDASGHALAGLQQQDFTILDNQQPQVITAFQSIDAADADPPVEATLVLDTTNLSATNIGFERDQVEKFLGQNDGHLAIPVSIAIFSETDTQITPPSRDGKALIAILHSAKTGLRAIGRSAGAAGASERLDWSLRALSNLAASENRRPGRKLMIWLSPGWPMFADSTYDIPKSERIRIFNSVVLFSTALRKARVTLYSIDPLGAGQDGFRSFRYQEFLKPATSFQQVTPGSLALPVMATQTGGLVFPATNELVSKITACIADARPFYTVSFDPVAGSRADEYHSLAVKIGKPGAAARTRSGYYAEP